MPTIDLIRICNPICNNTSFTVKDGELLVLVGTTGAGKTTLLNVIAGLTDYSGSVRFDGESVDHLSPARRRIGYLFQEFALFPHLTVRENVAFGLQAGRWKRSRIDCRVHELLTLLRIEPLANRYPRTLSGGEKQRAALARALAPLPKILLLDEPFSNLDQQTARFLRLELKNLHQKLMLTTVYVTHNHEEAFAMGDRIAVVNRGSIEQIDPPSQILFDSKSPAVAELFGSPNIFSCRAVRALGCGLGEAYCDDFSLIVPYQGGVIDKIAVLPSSIGISRGSDGGPEPNRILGRIIAVLRKPPLVSVHLRIQGQGLLAELPEQAWDAMGLKDTDPVWATIAFTEIMVRQSRYGIGEEKTHNTQGAFYDQASTPERVSAVRVSASMDGNRTAVFPDSHWSDPGRSKGARNGDGVRRGIDSQRRQ